MSPEDFKKTRASLFQKHGFEGQSRWLEDPRGRKTHALVRDAGGVPTVLVHGGLAEGSVWAKLTGHLPGSVVVLDRPGCGLSYPIDYRGVDYRQHASDWLKDVLDALKAPRVNLVRNSMGGYFSMAFALAHPDRVEHLILAGAPASLVQRRRQPLPCAGRSSETRTATLGSPSLIAPKARTSGKSPTISLAPTQIMFRRTTVSSGAGCLPAVSSVWRQGLAMRSG
jgi:pimeloyl-ACP methyl ester carboxylesterase